MSGTVQSGITASHDLLSAWADALASSATRLLTVKIQSESLVVDRQADVKGSAEEDYALVGQSVAGDEPQYLLFRLEATADSAWVFVSWVPDNASVRAKMLYASTRATLLKSLGDARFEISIFATDKSDLSFDSYLAHLKHHSSAAPLTAREQEMAEIKAAEAATARSEPASNEARSMTGVTVGLEWTDEAKDLVGTLVGEGVSDGAIVRLEIDTKTEKVVASSPQPTSLELPASQPSYTFYVHSGTLVFIYSCPPTSPIKSRLVYSSSSAGVVSSAAALGVKVGKKLETSSPEEVDQDYIASELGELATPGSGSGATTPNTTTTSAPLPVNEKPAFARPARPGRKR